MSTVDLRRVQEVFEAVADLPAGERDVKLAELCGQNAQLADTVRGLLAADASTDQRLARPASELASQLLGDAAPTVPQRVGKFEVLRVLGEGGMGVVYLARQPQPDRLVALKVIRSALPSGPLLRRFAQEASVLAKLQHPSIAQIYETGAAPALGRQSMPFLVLEYVDGPPLLQYCKKHKLPPRQRVGLVIDVCRAVQYAHQRGIIHRDLKPGNILVTGVPDGSGGASRPLPKILDFGVARTLDDGATAHTLAGQLIGTLAYMSPEQASGQTADTRSDIYALGVILYELLSGTLPIDVRRDTIQIAARKVAMQPPAALPAPLLGPRDDLRAVVSKALEKEPSQRYQSVGELAEDLQLWLEGRPVLAKPASTFTQLASLARRNKPATAGLFIAVACLLAVGAVAVWQATVATRAQRMAQAEARRATAIKDYVLSDLVQSSTPGGRLGPSAPISAFLENAVERLPQTFPDDPLLQAEVRAELGGAYFHLGETQRGRSELEIAIPQLERLAGDTDPRTLRARLWHNNTVHAFREFDAALRQGEEVLAIIDADPALRANTRLLAQALTQLGEVTQVLGRHDEAAAYLERGLALPDLNSAQRRGLLSSKNASLYAQGKWAQARAGLEELLANADLASPSERIHIISTRNALTNVLMRMNDPQAALAQIELAYEDARAVLTPGHHVLAYVALSRAAVLQRLRRYEEATRFAQEAVTSLRATLDANSWEVERAAVMLRDNASLSKNPSAVWEHGLAVVRMRMFASGAGEGDAVVNVLTATAERLTAAGEPTTQAQVFAAALALRESWGETYPPHRARLLANLGRAAARLRDPQAHTLLAEARAAITDATNNPEEVNKVIAAAEGETGVVGGPDHP